MSSHFIHRQKTVGSFQCHCQLLICGHTGEAALVDPGDEPEALVDWLEKVQASLLRPLCLKYLLHTHAHLDHVGGTRQVKLQWRGAGVPQIGLHAADEPLYQALKKQGALFGFQYEDPLPVDFYLEDDQTICLGRMKLSILHTPGHSPGSVCIRCHADASQGWVVDRLLSGDTLFRRSVGRTDLWGGDAEVLLKSIRSRLFSLEEGTEVYPGHGPPTVLLDEKKHNPFLS